MEAQINSVKQKSKISTRQLVVMAMLTAISVVFVSLIHFPIFPAAAFLEYDPADIPILIGTLMYGPVAGVILTVVASLIQGMTVSAGSGIIGIIMHVFATGICAFAAGGIYNRNKTRKNAAIGLAIGAILMTIAMVIMNLIFTPLFMGAPLEAVISMLVPIIIPFNLLKAGINCIFTFILFGGISKAINK